MAKTKNQKGSCSVQGRPVDEVLRELWMQAQVHDGMQPDHNAKFVVFSDGNPYIERHDRIMRLVMQAARHANVAAAAKCRRCGKNKHSPDCGCMPHER